MEFSVADPMTLSAIFHDNKRHDILEFNWSSIPEESSMIELSLIYKSQHAQRKITALSERERERIRLRNYSSYQLNESVSEWMDIAWVRERTKESVLKTSREGKIRPSIYLGIRTCVQHLSMPTRYRRTNNICGIRISGICICIFIRELWTTYSSNSLLNVYYKFLEALRENMYLYYRFPVVRLQYIMQIFPFPIYIEFDTRDAIAIHTGEAHHPRVPALSPTLMISRYPRLWFQSAGHDGIWRLKIFLPRTCRRRTLFVRSPRERRGYSRESVRFAK